MPWQSLKNLPFSHLATRKPEFPEFVDILELEFNDLVVWLEIKGESDVEQKALELLTAAITGEQSSPSATTYGGEAALLPYNYTVTVRGASQIPPALRNRLGIQSGQQPAAIVSVPHLAFAVIRRPTEGEGTLAAAKSAIRSRSDFRPRSFLTALQARGPAALRTLIGEVANAGEAAEETRGRIRERLTRVLHFSDDELDTLLEGQASTIDLSKTSTANSLREWCAQLAFGNQSGCEVSEFQLDLTSMRVHAVVNLSHKHSWGTLAQAAAAVNESVSGAAIAATDFLSDTAKRQLDSFQDRVAEGEAAFGRATDAAEAATQRVDAQARAVRNAAGQAAESASEASRALTAFREARSLVQARQRQVDRANAALDDAKAALSNARDQLNDAIAHYDGWRPPNIFRRWHF